MTREQAIECNRVWQEANSKSPKNMIDLFVALGMLKLDEPVTAYQVLKGCGYGPLAVQDILDHLDLAGLKIVEK